MKTKTRHRVLAFVMAALMVVGIMPFSMLTGIFSSKAQAKTVTASIDISKGLEAGKVYGDDSIVKLEVLADMPVKEGSGATVEGVKYDAFIQQPKANPKPNNGAVPTEGAAFKMTAVTDSKITFVTKAASGKKMYFVEASASEQTISEDATEGSHTYSMTAGKTYYFYVSGSKACVYGISYSYNKASDYKKVSVDISKGLSAGTVYGDKEISDLEVLADMPVKEGSGATVEGVKYDAFIQQPKANPKPNNGAVPTEGAAFKMTAVTDSKITFVTKAASGKKMYFVEASASEQTISEDATEGSHTYSMTAGKTYYFYVSGSKACVYAISLEKGTPDLDWSKVESPVLETPVVDGSKVSVGWNAPLGDDGGEQLVVNMYSGEKVVDSKIIKGSNSKGTAEFNPTATGDYTFKAVLSRSGEKDKESNEVKAEGFVLPLAAPSNLFATSKGNGKMLIEWDAVPEADSYEVSYSTDGTTYSEAVTATDTKQLLSGLTVGTEYTFKVVAVRNNPATKKEAIVKGTATADEIRKWGSVTYGNGHEDGKDTSKDSITGSALDGSVTIKSASGKIVPDSYDGLTFYYTEIPTTENFILRAKVKVNSWKLSNGQEGFGLMATDRLGGSGWNNQYMAIASKVEYYWDAEENRVSTDDTLDKVTHKLGIGSIEKKGLTTDNIKDIEANKTAVIKANFTSTTTPLELRYPDYKNVIGNAQEEVRGTAGDAITEMYMTIQKNNTGYFITYESVDGSYKTTKKYYDPKALEYLDSENVYAGFFAARNANVTFSDISITTSNPATDPAPEERPIELIAVNTKVQSPSATGTPDYTFAFTANCDGKLSIADKDGNFIAEDVEVKAKTAVNAANVVLTKGKNDFKLYFTPAEGYIPGEYMAMQSYETKEIDFTVTYKTIGEAGQSIWVAPDAKGSGSKEDPMSIYDAVKYVQPSQQIVLMEGTYKLESSLKLARGINGTAENMIYMIADPNATTRPVLDFQELSTGMIIGGDYWYFKGFDVTRSANAQKGIQVSGNHNTLDQINAYHNGNTGIQISRLNSTDEYENWPSYNLILNCTSYGNADAGYEDADGFAAKLTVGDGNVFDGCIAHHNADDGWDLFAKVQTGSIGVVTIKNSIAYANGYLEDGTDAGNGNGFKMGGDSMPGAHVLDNCISFCNKAKGIDSNSCPDIKIKNSTSIDNESYNVALYTKTAENTDYEATGIISYRTGFDSDTVARTAGLNVKEDLEPKGTQDIKKIYKTTNYFWDTASKTSVNSEGATVSTDWFKSLDYSAILDGVKSVGTITRNADGTIALGDVFALTDKAPAGVGADFSHDKLTASVSPVIGESVTTGDTSNIAFLLALFLMSGAAIAAVCIYDRKRRIVK
ncbi:fibronectin type III domain-containing protein [Lachnospira hominis (ex Liu et al. 2021)]|uniref:Fibronectin type III domain-containing protein n=1 Tax=Lachnospira hominis (ex Liu et al. 2021) TaxID=2763051 RepID=A0ABR7FXB7_9FIRM|nr:fibronectin type III domain-containing protein [Lachnospira hominis]MBC5679835.1 fibronectin type III domain-containing protein [Lachnospira hominis]